MAQYKVIQDVEADDKFLGPLSFKQFIFAGIAAVSIYLTFLSLGRGFWPALIFFLPIIVVTGFLAWPWARDQPTEVWLAARIRFFIKPRRRVWNQSGIKELVMITAPKQLEQNLTKGFTGEEATSKLSSLATMLDSRGWAIKNSSLNVAPVDSYQPVLGSNDRLLDATAFAQEVSDVDVNASDDIMDASSNNVAQHFETMIQQSESEHKQVLQQKISAARQHQKESDPKEAADFWFLNQGAGKTIRPKPATQQGEQPKTQSPESRVQSSQLPTLSSQPVPSPSSADEEALLARLHNSQAQASQTTGFGHLKTLQPLTPQTQLLTPHSSLVTSPLQTASATPVNPGIIEPVKNTVEQHLPDDEVVIPLH